MPTNILYYVHDPMCSWCWAYRPTLANLRQQLAPLPVRFAPLLGGLAPDSNAPMPAAMQAKLQHIWRTLEQQVGTPFNYDFWHQCAPRRSTYPACRALLAAQAQGQEDAMIEAIQRSNYLRAMNPAEDTTLIQLAKELGLNATLFSQTLSSPATQARLLQQVSFARRLPIAGFPSLVLTQGAQNHAIPLDYHNAAPSLSAIAQYL